MNWKKERKGGLQTDLSQCDIILLDYYYLDQEGCVFSCVCFLFVIYISSNFPLTFFKIARFLLTSQGMKNQAYRWLVSMSGSNPNKQCRSSGFKYVYVILD